MNTLAQIKKAKLIGRGGGCFPVAKKWEMVKKAKGERKFVVCNASEGEPGVRKDLYIMENHPERVIDGIRLALEYLKADTAYFYINPNYHKKVSKILEKHIGELPIEIFKKDHTAGYVGGEETSALNHIEGRRVEPRLRPPFPPQHGLWGYPTLVNNVETFYDISMVCAGEYKRNRFCTINGDCMWHGVYDLAEDLTINEILSLTDNYPKFEFFVQVGGDASGLVLNQDQLDQGVVGSASITVYSTLKHSPVDLMKGWVNFYLKESCGQCTPCREGVYRLNEVLDQAEPDWEWFSDLLTNLSETSLCGLGCSVPIAARSYVENVLSRRPDNKIVLPRGSKKFICECFK